MITTRDLHTRELDISRHVTECLLRNTANKILLLLCEKLNPENCLQNYRSPAFSLCERLFPLR